MWEVDEPAVWRICLDGRVEENWAEWFNWASVRSVVCPDGGWQTVAEGELRDRAALGGLINRMWDTSISVLSLDRISDQTKREDIVTDLTGTLADQGALHGVLDRIWNLNLTAQSVSTAPADARRAGPVE